MTTPSPNPNPSYKPSEGKREEFRKYLEKNGVMDALTRVLVNLYEETEKPEDALEYIRDKLAVIAGLETYKQLQQKLTDSDNKIKDLETQLQAAGKTGDGEVTPTGGSISQPSPDAAVAAAGTPADGAPVAPAATDKSGAAAEDVTPAAPAAAADNPEAPVAEAAAAPVDSPAKTETPAAAPADAAPAKSPDAADPAK